jgi:hypothetical protein
MTQAFVTARRAASRGLCRPLGNLAALLGAGAATT